MAKREPEPQPHNQDPLIQAAIEAAAVQSQGLFQRRVIVTLVGAMAINSFMIAIALGIITYNSVNNAPKIDCIYHISKTVGNDLHHLAENDRKPVDYPAVTCKQ